MLHRQREEVDMDRQAALALIDRTDMKAVRQRIADGTFDQPPGWACDAATVVLSPHPDAVAVVARVIAHTEDPEDYR